MTKPSLGPPVCLNGKKKKPTPFKLKTKHPFICSPPQHIPTTSFFHLVLALVLPLAGTINSNFKKKSPYLLYLLN